MVMRVRRVVPDVKVRMFPPPYGETTSPCCLSRGTTDYWASRGVTEFREPTSPALLVPFLAGRTVDVHSSAVLRRNRTRPNQCDEAQVVFLVFARVVVQVEVGVTYLTFVSAVAVVLGLEVDDCHTDRLPVALHIEAQKHSGPCRQRRMTVAGRTADLTRLPYSVITSAPCPIR